MPLLNVLGTTYTRIVICIYTLLALVLFLVMIVFVYLFLFACFDFM